VRIKAYPVAAKAGLLWAYLGPPPAPLVPTWEPFTWRNGFVQIVFSEVPCNWFQCQENSIDPVHFEWLHSNWTRVLQSDKGPKPPTHLKIGFEEFEYGFVYKRVLEGGSEEDESWKIGRVCLWPHCLYAGAFDWNVPIDDENTLRNVWMVHPLPGSRPFHQEKIPHWRARLDDPGSDWSTARWTNQDFAITASQGRIADRSREHLGASDRGVILMRRRFLADLDVVAAGGDPKGIVRDPSRNERIPLPLMSDQTNVPPQVIPPPLEGQPPEITEEIARVFDENRI
jgi:5,5'-dehydrodivanillate O-demethylase